MGKSCNNIEEKLKLLPDSVKILRRKRYDYFREISFFALFEPKCYHFKPISMYSESQNFLP